MALSNGGGTSGEVSHERLFRTNPETWVGEVRTEDWKAKVIYRLSERRSPTELRVYEVFEFSGPEDTRKYDVTVYDIVDGCLVAADDSLKRVGWFVQTDWEQREPEKFQAHVTEIQKELGQRPGTEDVVHAAND